MVRIVKIGGQRLIDVYELAFYFKNGEYTFFKCDENGVPVIRHHADQIRYESCLFGSWDGDEVGLPEVLKTTKLEQYPAILECDCGRRISLDMDITVDNICECWATYSQDAIKSLYREFLPK